MKQLSSGKLCEQMNFGNVVRLPGSAFQCLFEFSGHEFKARPVSMAVDFSPASSAIGGRAGFNQSWGFAGGFDGGRMPESRGCKQGSDCGVL